MEPKEFLESKGIDTEDIKLEERQSGYGTSYTYVDFDYRIFELMDEYADSKFSNSGNVSVHQP